MTTAQRFEELYRELAPADAKPFKADSKQAQLVLQIVERMAQPDDLDTSCQRLMDWVASLDPVYAQRIEVVAIERKWNARMILGAFVCYCFDNELQMSLPLHPYFEPGYTPAGRDATCPQCRERFEPKYGGQPFCSNECAEAAGVVTVAKRVPEKPPVMPPQLPAAQAPLEMPAPVELAAVQETF